MTDPDRDVIAIDVGQTGTRLCVVSGSQSRSAQLPLTASPGESIFTDQNGLEILVDRIQQLAETTSASMAISLSGFSPRLRYGEFAAALSSRLGAVRVAVASDAFATAVGSLGNEPGVSVTWGTGVVALAFKGNGTYSQVDGRGYLLGDRGGGWWVGQHGIVAGLDFKEGRRGSQCLGTAIDRGFESRDELFDAVYSSAAPTSLLASFAPHVLSCAQAGDDIANQILAEATEEVFLTIETAWSQVGNGSRIVVAGGMIRSPGPHTEKLAALVRASTGVELEMDDGAAMAGAISIATDAGTLSSSELCRTFVG